MKYVTSLMLAGAAALALGVGTARADGADVVQDYWAAEQRVAAEQLAVRQAAEETARQASVLKAAVDQAVAARIGERHVAAHTVPRSDPAMSHRMRHASASSVYSFGG